MATRTRAASAGHIRKPGKPQLALIRAASTAARRLKRAIESERIYVTEINSSRIPYALLTKAFHVHQSVLLLCKAGFGSEAYGLSRTLIEIHIALRWITNQEEVARCDGYAEFVTKRKEYWAMILQKYSPTHPESAGALKYVDNLYGKYTKKYKWYTFWANVQDKLKGMAKELEVLYKFPSAQRDALWDYEGPYSMASDHVHATAVAIEDVVAKNGVLYKVANVRDRKLIENAIFTATAWLFQIFMRVDAARQLGLQKKIDKAWIPFEKLY